MNKQPSDYQKPADWKMRKEWAKGYPGRWNGSQEQMAGENIKAGKEMSHIDVIELFDIKSGTSGDNESHDNFIYYRNNWIKLVEGGSITLPSAVDRFSLPKDMEVRS
eukprot:GHVU01184066.1.p1 GENE.GHVU01184066.1~~GHVU01184066.1.p1  ORF type:complete len:107 (+),score=19.57 GHVU01184066.1:217-537(+)